MDRAAGINESGQINSVLHSSTSTSTFGLCLNVCSVPRAASRVEGNNPAVAERKEPPQLQAGQLQLGPVHQERGLGLAAGEETEAPVETRTAFKSQFFPDPTKKIQYQPVN